MDRSLASDSTTMGYPSETFSPVRDQLPARPAPAAHFPHGAASSSRYIQSGHPSGSEQYALCYYDHEMPPGTSVSSAGGSSLQTAATVDTIDLEKGDYPVSWTQQPQESCRSSASRKTKKKQEMAERNNPYFTSASTLSRDRPSVSTVANEDDVMIEQHTDLENKAMKILLFLSGPCALLAGLLCGYALLATLVLCLTHPFRLCFTKGASLKERSLSTLSSALRFQLRCIYTPTNLEGHSVSSLLLAHMLAPFISMGVAVAAWTVAVYWVFAAIVGDPDGSEGGCDDGRATVLGLRGWWGGCLEKPLKV